MNNIPISIALITLLMGCALALDIENGVEMKQGEFAAERLFEKGIGEPWVGGDSPYSHFSQYYWIDRWSDFKKPKKYIDVPKRIPINLSKIAE